ncbi:MAG TPA: fumarate/nitrate reduction transcriptional regulator Fnr [Burkholderiales bacterium]|nr:fumarate/nitrate reduction transcriptional regulator Fnr [Burkholderiales bacterium]
MGIAVTAEIAPATFVSKDRQTTSSVDVERRPTRCSTCSLRELCLPRGIKSADAKSVDELVFMRRHIRRGESLYRTGAPFKYLYAVRSGFLKSYIIADDGREQVTGFQMAGEMVGLDGIESDAHNLNVEAIEDTMVCVIPFARLEQLASRVPELQRQFYRMMSHEIVRDQGVMMLLGTMQANERVAAFLLNLSQRFAARGYAAAEFLLRMTREEIGSYLGLKLETVSRVFSKLQKARLIEIRNKHVRIRNPSGLKAVLDQAM